VIQTPKICELPDQAAHDLAFSLDRRLQVALATLTGGLSPISLALASTDWGYHMATSIGALMCHTLETWHQALEAQSRGANLTSDDPRYADANWQVWPFSQAKDIHQMVESWWSKATRLRGMEHHHQDVMHFFIRQWLDMLSPSNSPWLNPTILKTMFDTQGISVALGMAHAVDDWRDSQGWPRLKEERPFQIGKDVACTPGHIIHRNHLAELIQYTPCTQQVQREPIFIVPSWIMKYYILDLSPVNSMVRYLVAQGHTVFMLSWRNPDESDALLDMRDYLELGVLNNLAVVTERTHGVPIHTVGYCLGGTLLGLAVAALSRPGSIKGAEKIAPIASMTLLAAQLDFSNPGELGVFIDEPQVSLLEDIMAEKGFLTGRQMATCFQFLKARDLFWSARIREYWLGQPDVMNDLMFWNADVTRMPASMHSEYLHKFYLHNALALGQYDVDDQPVSLSDIRVPVFAVGTVKDHVTPWQSAYEVTRLTQSEVTFVLASGGHNAGILSPPNATDRCYQQLTIPLDLRIESPQSWLSMAKTINGSWWPAWHGWLVARSSGTLDANQREALDPIAPAPGSYVFVRYDD
jgi:polyhydroxyalkanoate synthase